MIQLNIDKQNTCFVSSNAHKNVQFHKQLRHGVEGGIMSQGIYESQKIHKQTNTTYTKIELGNISLIHISTFQIGYIHHNQSTNYS